MWAVVGPCMFCFGSALGCGVCRWLGPRVLVRGCRDHNSNPLLVRTLCGYAVCVQYDPLAPRKIKNYLASLASITGMDEEGHLVGDEYFMPDFTEVGPGHTPPPHDTHTTCRAPTHAYPCPYPCLPVPLPMPSPCPYPCLAVPWCPCKPPSPLPCWHLPPPRPVVLACPSCVLDCAPRRFVRYP